MYLKLELIKIALIELQRLHPFYGITFLVCKRGHLPVGKSVTFPINRNEETFLCEYYKPDISSKYFFQPFRTSSRTGHWVRPKYAWSGSQSTRTRGHLAGAFIHARRTDQWGWAPAYVDVLRGKLEQDDGERIPAFWLAVWLYRGQEWPHSASASSVIKKFLRDFSITDAERQELFKVVPPDLPGGILTDQPYSDAHVLKLIGRPPDARPEEGGTLKSLELQAVGPMRRMVFNPAERLTVVTGDNGLGKTFLLECAWWSLTGDWAGQQAYPRLDAAPREASITFEIVGKKDFPQKRSIQYNWESQSWPAPKDRPTIPGLILYARVDGSFAIWDPVRHAMGYTSESPGALRFSRDDVLRGLDGRIEGLLRDWVKWQNAKDRTLFATFCEVLRHLSPPDMSPLQPGEPVRVPNESRDVPTLIHSYGTVPFIAESAGVKRIVTIAYLLVWAWNEHKIYSGLAKKAPQDKLVILVDEIEAHLHPKWQRVVLPALLGLTQILRQDLRSQILVATHSPLILASIESTFASETDKLFHLQITSKGAVVFNEVPFVRYGRVDSWLTSDVFELRQARSREAERALEHANSLLGLGDPNPDEIRAVSTELSQVLPQDDTFWPRWIFFARRKGVKL